MKSEWKQHIEACVTMTWTLITPVSSHRCSCCCSQVHRTCVTLCDPVWPQHSSTDRTLLFNGSVHSGVDVESSRAPVHLNLDDPQSDESRWSQKTTGGSSESPLTPILKLYSSVCSVGDFGSIVNDIIWWHHHSYCTNRRINKATAHHVHVFILLITSKVKLELKGHFFILINNKMKR